MIACENEDCSNVRMVSHRMSEDNGCAKGEMVLPRLPQSSNEKGLLHQQATKIENNAHYSALITQYGSTVYIGIAMGGLPL